MHTFSQAIPVSNDDDEETVVDGDDECDEKMTWFT